MSRSVALTHEHRTIVDDIAIQAEVKHEQLQLHYRTITAVVIAIINYKSSYCVYSNNYKELHRAITAAVKAVTNYSCS